MHTTYIPSSLMRCMWEAHTCPTTTILYVHACVYVCLQAHLPHPHRPQTHWPRTQSQYYMMYTLGTHCNEQTVTGPKYTRAHQTQSAQHTHKVHTYVQFIPEDITGTVSACTYVRTYVHSVTVYRIQAPRAKLLTQQHLQLVEDHIYAIVRWNLPTTNLDANTLCMNGLRHRHSNSHHSTLATTYFS